MIEKVAKTHVHLKRNYSINKKLKNSSIIVQRIIIVRWEDGKKNAIDFIKTKNPVYKDNNKFHY